MLGLQLASPITTPQPMANGTLSPLPTSRCAMVSLIKPFSDCCQTQALIVHRFDFSSYRCQRRSPRVWGDAEALEDLVDVLLGVGPLLTCSRVACGESVADLSRREALGVELADVFTDTAEVEELDRRGCVVEPVHLLPGV